MRNSKSVTHNGVLWPNQLTKKVYPSKLSFLAAVTHTYIHMSWVIWQHIVWKTSINIWDKT